MSVNYQDFLIDNALEHEHGRDKSFGRICSFCSCVSNYGKKSFLSSSKSVFRIRFSEKYNLGKTFSSGAFSTVAIATEKYSQIDYAVKMYTKKFFDLDDVNALKNEIEILHSLNHPHIIKLFSVYDEPETYFLVTELANGGELFDRIASKHKYTEKEARDISRIMFDVVGYCHSKRIAHRDLKPENFLLASKDNDVDIKLADFGFAKRLSYPSSLTTLCGSPYFVAPEILLRKRYGVQVDMWSLGIIIYTILTGYLPFQDDDRTVLYGKICKGKYILRDEDWRNISTDANNLVFSLLVLNPEKRLSAVKGLKHKWFENNKETLQTFDLKRATSNLKRIKRKKLTLKSVGYSVMFLNLKTRKRLSLGIDSIQNISKIDEEEDSDMRYTI